MTPPPANATLSVWKAPPSASEPAADPSKPSTVLSGDASATAEDAGPEDFGALVDEAAVPGNPMPTAPAVDPSGEIQAAMAALIAAPLPMPAENPLPEAVPAGQSEPTLVESTVAQPSTRWLPAPKQAQPPALPAPPPPEQIAASDGSEQEYLSPDAPPQSLPATPEPQEKPSRLAFSADGTPPAMQVRMVKPSPSMEMVARFEAQVSTRVITLPAERPAAGGTEKHPSPAPLPLGIIDRVGDTSKAEPAGPAPADRATMIEALGNRIAEHAVAFKQLGAASLDVALRPDGQTELSLRLSLRQGQLEITAHLQRGDFDTLRQRWPALQESLASQGIRLDPLTAAEPGTGWTATHTFEGGTNGRQQWAEQSASAADWADEPVRTGPRGEQRPARSRARTATGKHRGWESWA